MDKMNVVAFVPKDCLYEIFQASAIDLMLSKGHAYTLLETIKDSMAKYLARDILNKYGKETITTVSHYTSEVEHRLRLFVFNEQSLEEFAKRIIKATKDGSYT